MSAVMSTLSMISGGRRAHRKLASSRKSGQLSDAGDDRRSQQELNNKQRSASLQTLETGGVVDLDTLEAKMASIEVSLAGCGRRGGARELDALRAALLDKDTLIQNLKKQLSASLSAARLAAQAPSPAGPRGTRMSRGGREEPAALSAEERRALEDRATALNADLQTRRDNIQELRKRLEHTHVTESIDSRIEQAELQYRLGREELELLSLGEQARALALLIEHASAAARQDNTLYSVVEECGGRALLVCAEEGAGSARWGVEARGAGLAVHWAEEHSPLRPGDRLIEVNGTSMVSCSSEDELQRALAAARPARLVLLRDQRPTHPPHSSQPTNTFTHSEAAALRSELGALRAAAEQAERAKEGLRADNTRLTHRISYLEDQVAELLARHAQLHPVSSSDSCITVNKTKKNVTNINITTEPQQPSRPSPKSEVQVFQKGPDITAIVAKLPGLDAAEVDLPVLRPRSNASGASSRAAVSPRASPVPQRRAHSSHGAEPRAGRVRHSISHHCIHASVDYGAETDAAIRMIERNQRHMEKQRMKNERFNKSQTEDRFRSDSDLDAKDSHSTSRSCEPRHYEIKKAADRIEESIKKTNWAERKTLSIIEQLKKSQRLRKMKKNDSSEDIQLESDRHYTYHRIDGKVLENAHKSSRRSSKVHCRSAKSSEFESECSDYPNGEMYSSSPRLDYGSESCSTRTSHYKRGEEGRSRPTPPRKPLRLSLHKARSAHSILNGSESETPSRPPSEACTGDGGPDSPHKRPVKRTYAADRWAREKIRDPSRATPRPQRKLLHGLSACEAPAADDLYPQSMHAPAPGSAPPRPNGLVHTGKWC
ncbi:uncharacterized protein LOC106718974 [Papilio machaon]|uniref:uncharacterized protein LOC106718974 n=1 Tax=Papilio machaon TaxID=76193 RepID=UPI001E66497C|nr:uncharacterized protein LOC106718974 [Papilio machaon]